jgi:hypothetical protein
MHSGWRSRLRSEEPSGWVAAFGCRPDSKGGIYLAA